MLKTCSIATLLLVFLLPAVAQQAPAAATQEAPSAVGDVCSDPAAVRGMVNPVKPTAESLAQGKKYFGYDCSMCHGQNGNGKGEVDTGEKLPDFTDPAGLKSVSDGEIFCSLKHGRGHMPLERVRITPNELWNLVNYVRSLSK